MAYDPLPNPIETTRKWVEKNRPDLRDAYAAAAVIPAAEFLIALSFTAGIAHGEQKNDPAGHE